MSDPIVIERRVGAPPSLVYSYLTESARWALWQGVSAGIDPRPGGIFAVTMPNGSRARGEFVELIPDQRVVFSWGWIDHPGVPPGSSTVVIDLIPEDEGTLIRLTHSGLPSEEIELHTAGWNRYLPRLALAAQGGEPEPDRMVP
jgi:uncharacterized protein YndB with AHSA1/START domain